MVDLLIILIFLIVILAAVCVRLIKDKQWFQRKRLGDLLMQIETANSTDDIIELANELELLKANLIGSDIDHTIKESPFDITQEDSFSEDVTIGEYLAKTKCEPLEQDNVVSIFKSD
ncbi:MAG: hypothetical protein CMB99_02915 [Flavobacteriaceae bacterium]|nr:hypothetical protein [Flavobacteriaceae bacterium]|tara:strand:- start:5679 stop:6029 length:351 start_codon:yes stop_codon:yes gene_type:complete